MFVFDRSMGHGHRSVPWLSLGIIRIAVFLGTLVCVVTVIAPSVSAQGNGPKNKGGGDFKDLQVCITISLGGGLSGDSVASYCGSQRGITAFVGRRRGINMELKANQSRTLSLTLGTRLADVDGDPDPNNDGGVVNQPSEGDWSNHPAPTLPAGGIIGEFQVAYRVNVLHMGEPGEEPNPNGRNGRLRFEDASGQPWTLLWGSHLQPGGFQGTNPNAPDVEILRQNDGSGQLINEWDARSTGDSARAGAATAFLWRDNGVHGPQDYWGAFDVWFAYFATEEEP